MLKLFRTIRRRLLNSGRLRKYLVYAVGEILLVMIGILLALQVNNYNEARKSAIEENVYLHRFQLDLRADSLYFSQRIQETREVLSGFYTMLHEAHKTQQSQRDFEEWLSLSMFP